MLAIRIAVVAAGYILVVLLLGTAVVRAAFGPVGVALWVVLQIAFFAHLWWTTHRSAAPAA